MLCYKVDRTGTKVVMVPQKEKKDYTFMANIFDLCTECLEKGVIPDPEVTFFPLDMNRYFKMFPFQYPIDQEALRKRKHGFDKVHIS